LKYRNYKEDIRKVIDWGEAFEVFFIGFGGVFICLVILQVSIIVFSKIVGKDEEIEKDNG